MSWAQADEGHRPCRPSRGASLHGTSAARRAIESVVATVFEVDARELQARSRGSARTAFGRQVAMYIAHVACGISLTDVGTLFGRDPHHRLSCLQPRGGQAGRSRPRLPA
jgi:hypothetical protein